MVQMKHGNSLPIEVETRNLAEVREAADLGVDRIMLDNMSRRCMKRACALIEGRARIEASGNMTVRRVRRLRRLPLDFISVGAITSTAGHADFSLLVEACTREAERG
jgi:nicotinate-nucleotide pyrophosphorylase (carboxylating)